LRCWGLVIKTLGELVTVLVAVKKLAGGTLVSI